MAEYQITCIIKADRNSDITGITHVGTAGKHWTVAEVISALASGSKFYVEVRKKRAYVSAYPDSKPRYIRTNADSTTVDNLLELPNCL
jgi:hypothetical protein